jgi:hypothetical protein
MPQQGPELPPHLAKRKRSIDDIEPPNSPPRKVQAATAPSIVGPALPPSLNPDEVDIDSNSDDDYGPAPRSSKPPKNPSPPSRTQGPAPPPKNPDELDVQDSSDDDSYGPASQKTTHNPPPAKRILGPSLPPADLSTIPSHAPDDAASSSDSDDGYGPALPPAPGSVAARQVQEQEVAAAALLAASSSASSSTKQRRDDWMLVPPSQDSSARADPTQLKARRFASARGGGAVAPSKGISAIWTETPDEKRRRLEDEVLGRVETATAPSTSSSSKRDDREDEETQRRIREYNERNRGKSLFEAHRDKKNEKEEEDDPSMRAFDREKDMALGGRLGHGQKKEMMAKAADFGSRFQNGKYL